MWVRRYIEEMFIFFFKQKTAYDMLRSLVGSEMCIRDSDGADRAGRGGDWQRYRMAAAGVHA